MLHEDAPIAWRKEYKCVSPLGRGEKNGWLKSAGGIAFLKIFVWSFSPLFIETEGGKSGREQKGRPAAKGHGSDPNPGRCGNKIEIIIFKHCICTQRPHH